MKIIGKVIVKIFNNETTGYTVFKLRLDDEVITAVGETIDIEVGDEVELEGIYDSHKSYGHQFKFSSCIKVMPKDKSTLIQYISDNVKGIGKKTARNIVDEFLDDTIDVIKYKSEKLNNIAGLNEEKIDNLVSFFKNDWEKWNIVEFLSKFGVPVLVGNKIYDILKSDTINIVKEDPYSLLEFVKTLDFKIIDEIGIKQGIEKNNVNRIEHGILYYLTQITDYGHTCIDKDILINHASNMLQVEEKDIIDSIINLKFKEKIYESLIDDKEYVFRRAYYLAEKNIAKNIIKHAKKSSKKDYSIDIEKISDKQALVLSDEQKLAINTCLNNSISIITGGPGTGKTTIIKFIIDILDSNKKKYILAAPTRKSC
jgi:exodeoxyribonuclease V alpha subunit